MRLMGQLVGTTMLGLMLGLFPLFSALAEDSRANNEAKKVIESYFKALNEGDVETILRLYHRDSVFLPKNGPAVRGIDDITKAYRALFATATLNTTHVYHHVSVHGDVAIVESQANGTLTILDTKTVVPADDKELFVLRQIKNQWKIDRYMFNDSENPGP